MKSLNLAIVCAIFTLLVAVAMIVDYCNILPSFFSGYLCNFAVECLGVILTLIVIQKVLEKHNENKERQLERENILKRNEITIIYIEFYKRFLNCIITPLGEEKARNVSLPINFPIKDMIKNLYTISGYITNSLQKSSIELFFRHEENLRDNFISIINNIEFKYHPKFKELLLKYITMSIYNDMREAIINNRQVKFGNECIAELVEKMLDNGQIDEYYQLYLNKKLDANLASPYFMLYDLINDEQNIIVEYLNEIKRLQNQ